MIKGKNIKKRKLNSGSITVEATISLTAFMFTIITIYTIVNICLVQTKIGIAINSAAKELSQYSYLYALSGLNGSESKLAKAGAETKEEINGVLSDVNSVFTEIQNLGSSAGDKVESGDISGLLSTLESGYSNVEGSIGELKKSFESMASDPKKLAFGLAKIATTDGLNLVKSRLIAAPLSKAMCKKNLVAEKDGDVDSYLKSLGIVPDSSGSYYDGLDFSQSSLFPNGSNEIRITVSYKVKIIALLPIDFSFHFTQSAVTHGWLAGEDSYRSPKKLEDSKNDTKNDTIWNNMTIAERSEFIRHQGIKNLETEGYEKTKKFTDVPLYNPTKDEFVAIFSMNPLYSKEGEDTLTLDDISETAIVTNIEQLCGKINSTTVGKKTVDTEIEKSDGGIEKKSYDCTNASNKIIIVVPEDPGLKEKIKSYVDKAKTSGVTVEIQASYGNGARTNKPETANGDKEE